MINYSLDVSECLIISSLLTIIRSFAGEKIRPAITIILEVSLLRILRKFTNLVKYSRIYLFISNDCHILGAEYLTQFKTYSRMRLCLI